MRFEAPLVPAVLLRRYKRFLADVEFAGGETTTVHCANPGAMTGLAEPGMRVFLSRSANPKRKLPWSWELVETGTGLVGINTAHPNRLVAEAVADGAIAPLAGYADIRREVRYGENSRVDLVLEGNGRAACYVEVKNAHLMRRSGLAEFPDSVTKRGAKHLNELANVVRNDGRAAMVYLIQRTDADTFALARDIDPAYGDAFDLARRAGVEMLAYDCAITTDAITVRAAVPIAET